MSQAAMFQEVELTDCCQIISGGTPSRKINEYWNGSINWFTPKDLSKLKTKHINQSPEKITESGHLNSSATMLPPNSLLLSSRAPIGHIAINTIESCTNQGFKSLVPNDKLLVDYLYYVILNKIPLLEQMGNGATFKELSKANLSRLKIPLPSLNEQQKIADILDAADNIRQKDQQLIEHYDRLSQSLFLDTFGVPSDNTHNFELVTIRDLVTTVNYGTSAKAQEGGQYPYLRMNNITYQGYMDFESLKYIDLIDKDKPKYLVCKGDILFNRTNSKELVGKTGLYNIDEQMAIAGYLIRVRTNEKANPYYLWRFLNSDYCKTVLNHMCKSIVGMANINAQELQNIKILLPPIALQNQFAERITQIEAQKALAQRNLEKSQNLFNCLLQSAFKGELT